MSDKGTHFRGFATRTLDVTVAGDAYRLLAPASSDELLDSPDVQSRFEEDEYMPYWADLWPTARLLAQRIARSEPGDGRRLLEIGCGLGLCGIVAARRGYAVVASDYDEDAVAFAAENARRHDVNLETSVVDWRTTRLEPPFDLVLGSDLLYERRNHEPVAAFVAAHLAPGGEAWIGDSFRPIADDAGAAFEKVGLVLTVDEEDGESMEGEPKRIRVLRLRHRTSGAS